MFKKNGAPGERFLKKTRHAQWEEIGWKFNHNATELAGAGP